MPLGKGRRRLVLGLSVLIVLFATIWFSCPLWFPWVLRPLAAHAGAHYTRYGRHGYSRFVLQDFAFTNQSLALRAQNIDAVVPSVWLWRVATGQQRHETF